MTQFSLEMFRQCIDVETSLTAVCETEISGIIGVALDGMAVCQKTNVSRMWCSQPHNVAFGPWKVFGDGPFASEANGEVEPVCPLSSVQVFLSMMVMPTTARTVAVVCYALQQGFFSGTRAQGHCFGHSDRGVDMSEGFSLWMRLMLLYTRDLGCPCFRTRAMP